MFARQIFRRLRHAESAIRVVQPRHQRIFQLPFAQPESRPRPANHMRALRHIFHPAGQNHLRFAQQNSLRRLRDRFHPRPAQAVHRHRRSFNRQSRFQSHMPRAVQGIRAGLHHVAKNHVVKFVRVHLRAPNRFLARHRPQFQRVRIVERPHIPDHRRACAFQNHRISRKHFPSRSILELRSRSTVQ